MNTPFAFFQQSNRLIKIWIVDPKANGNENSVVNLLARHKRDVYGTHIYTYGCRKMYPISICIAGTKWTDKLAWLEGGRGIPNPSRWLEDRSALMPTCYNTYPHYGWVALHKSLWTGGQPCVNRRRCRRHPRTYAPGKVARLHFYFILFSAAIAV